jgi:hypothetical protein
VGVEKWGVFWTICDSLEVIGGSSGVFENKTDCSASRAVSVLDSMSLCVLKSTGAEKRVPGARRIVVVAGPSHPKNREWH